MREVAAEQLYSEGANGRPALPPWRFPTTKESSMRRASWLFFFVLTAAMRPLAAQGASDKEGVRRAVLDYVEGFYEGDTTKLIRSIRPEVVKYGFFKPKADGPYAGEAMPWKEFLSYANGVKARGKPTPATAPKEITILDVADQTASAKLTAWWGIDYLHLAKFDNKWMITQVLWQSPPPKP